jgi:hypothetical protein
LAHLLNLNIILSNPGVFFARIRRQIRIIMPSSELEVKIESRLEITDGTTVLHILGVPKASVAHFGFKGNLRRVVCTLNGAETFACSLFPSKGNYFITLNKKLRDRLALKVGDTVAIEISKDNSKYGMPMPDEFSEVLRQDPEGERLFNELSLGNQRLMLKLIVFVKDVDKRIARSLAGIELLKLSEGKFDYHMQHDTMRLVSSADPSIEFLR